MDTIDKILVLFKELESSERRKLVSKLYKDTEILQMDGTHAKKCPHCNSNKIIKYGKHNEEQRYLCSGCGKTFKETTGTVLGSIHKKSLFLKYQEAMINEEYTSIKEMAKRFNISIPTAFTWRHKILLSLPEIEDKFEGESEMDDLWFRYSQKGRKGLKYSKKRGYSKHKGDNDYQVKVLTTANSKQTDMKVTNIGRLSKADIQRAMGSKLSSKTMLISDKHQSISAFAKSNSISHQTFKASEHTNDNDKGVQLLNNIAGRLDTLLNRTCNGVSTKYLQLYVNWFKFKENNKNKSIDLQQSILSKKYTWDIYSNIEKIYAEFIKHHSRRTYRCPTVKEFKAQNWNQDVVAQYTFL